MVYKNVEYSEMQEINGCIFLSELPSVLSGKRTERVAKFLCPCGNEFSTRIRSVIYGHANSCGCYQKKKLYESNVRHGNAKRGQETSEYKSWRAMFRRCTDKKDNHYHLYGGLGVKICDRWNDFENFLMDMGPKPTPKHSIDRFPNKNGNYEPSNCRWSTQSEQVRNRNLTLMATYLGETKSLAEWSEITGIPYDRLHHRIFEKKYPTEIAFLKRHFKKNEFLKYELST